MHLALLSTLVVATIGLHPGMHIALRTDNWKPRLAQLCPHRPIASY